MKPKLLLALALVLICGLIAWAMWRHPFGFALSGSEEQICAVILKITPIGTPINEAKTLIQTKMHPDTFYIFKLGKHQGTKIGCLIGQSGFFLFFDYNVSAFWIFDDKDRLVDVYVEKHINAL